MNPHAAPGRPRRRPAGRRTRRALPHRLALLAAAVGGTSEQAAALAGRVTAALPGRGDDLALLRAFAGLPEAASPEARGRLLVVLVDLDGRPLDDAAALLDLPLEEAHPLLDLARTGGRPLGVPCRGWGLAAGSGGLTAAEVEAGRDHLALCRRCRDRRTAVDQARRQLLARATGAAGLLGAGQLALAGGALSTGVALSDALGKAMSGVLGGKAAAGAVAGLAATVLATGAVVAVDPPAGFVPAAPPVAPTSGTVVAPSPVPPGVTTPRPQPTGLLPGALDPLLPTTLPLPVPTSLSGDADELPLPTGLLPTTLPTSLPSTLPTSLPTSLLPLPTLSPLPLLP